MRPALLFFMLLASTGEPCTGADSPYRVEIERWRKGEEKELFSDPRLMLVERLELGEGKFTIGSAASNDLVLPVGPPVLGTLTLEGKTVEIAMQPGITGTYNNRPTTKAILAFAERGAPNPLWIGSAGLSVTDRNGRIRLSVMDKQAEVVRARKPLRWFPVREKYRIAAKFVPFEKPATLPLPDSEGGRREYPSPGLVSFTLEGKQYTLQPVQSGERLFFVFRDTTSGKQTYGAGRFLLADAPKNGTVVLDFNKSTNPLCAYNAFVICPVPPKQNRLPVAIPAGELNYAADK